MLTDPVALARQKTTETLTASGTLYSIMWDTLVVTVSAIRHRRFALQECVSQAWFIVSVTLLPALLVAIPFGVIVALEVGSVASQIGAGSYTGAVDALAIIREAAPLTTALMLAGVAGSAICADLGARKIREEIDAIEVLGLSPLERLVAPRMVATIAVSLLLNAVVMLVGVLGGLTYTVFIAHQGAGGFLQTFSSFARLSDVVVAEVKSGLFGLTSAVVAAYKGLNVGGGAKGVGDAVNQSVVISFLLVFIINTVISEMAIIIFPAKVG